VPLRPARVGRAPPQDPDRVAARRDASSAVATRPARASRPRASCARWDIFARRSSAIAEEVLPRDASCLMRLMVAPAWSMKKIQF
jgi:hypothetical protein